MVYRYLQLITDMSILHTIVQISAIVISAKELQISVINCRHLD